MLNKKRLFVICLILFSILALMSLTQAQINYQFSVDNNGNEAELYELSVDMFPEYTTFSENPIYIDAGESKTIILTVNVPCEYEGAYRSNLIIYAQSSKKTIGTIPFDVNVPSCYGYDVQIGEKVITKGATKIVFKPYEGIYELCKGEEVAVPILITNTGQAKTLKFKLKGIDFAKLSGEKLFLKDNQNGVLYITIAPENEGNYTFNLGVMTDKSGNIPIDLSVKECYSVGISVSNVSVCGCETNSYNFFVKNKGLKKAEFGLELEGPEWLSLSLDQNFEIKSNESIGVGLDIDAPCSGFKTYNANIIAYLVDYPDIKAEDTIGITVLSEEDCYKTAIETEKSVIIDYKGISLPLKIINYGAKQLEYTIILEGPEWAKTDKNIIVLEEGDEKIINLNIKPGNDVDEGNYKIKIKLDSEEASYSKEILVKLRREGSIFETVTKISDSYSTYILSGVVVLLIILFLIFIAKKAKKTRSKKRKLKIKWLIWSITTILVLAVIVYLMIMFGSLLWYWAGWYRYYVYTGIALVVLIYLISRYLKPTQKNGNKETEKPKKTKEIEEKKKSEKKIEKRKKPKKKYLKHSLIMFIILILVGFFVYFSIYYGLLQYIKEFFLIYYPYIIAGVVLLVILILLLRFSGQIVNFLKGKNKKQKRKKTKF